MHVALVILPNSSFPESLIHSARYHLAPSVCQGPEIQTLSKDRPSAYSEGDYNFVQNTDRQLNNHMTAATETGGKKRSVLHAHAGVVREAQGAFPGKQYLT